MLQTFERNKLLQTLRGFAPCWGGSFGHTCVAAAEEKDENCEIKAWRRECLQNYAFLEKQIFDSELLRPVFFWIALMYWITIDSIGKLASKRWHVLAWTPCILSKAESSFSLAQCKSHSHHSFPTFAFLDRLQESYDCDEVWLGRLEGMPLAVACCMHFFHSWYVRIIYDPPCSSSCFWESCRLWVLAISPTCFSCIMTREHPHT